MPRPLSAKSGLLAALAVALSYYLAAKLGFALVFPQYLISVLWTPNAVLLAALLLIPPRSWWVVLLAVLPAHVIVHLQAGLAYPPIAATYVGNTGEALISAVLLRRLVGGPPWFDSFKRVATFAIVTAVAVSISTLLVAPLVLDGAPPSVYWDVCQLRFFSTVLATLTVTPVLVTLGGGGAPDLRRVPRRRYVEVGAFSAALLAVTFAAFGWNTVGPGIGLVLLYAPVPLLLWAAVRFGPGGVSSSLLVVMLLTIWAAIHGRGPFTTPSPADATRSIQLLFIVGSLALLSLAGAVQERERAQETARVNQDIAREHKEHLELALNAATMGSWEWRIDESVIRVSPESARVLGFPPGTASHTVEQLAGLIHPEDRRRVLDSLSQAAVDATPMELDFRVVRGDGSVRWVLSKGRAVENRLGPPVRMLGLKADVTERKKADALNVAQNRVLEMVAVGAPLARVLEALGSLVESQVDGLRCVVTLLDRSRDWGADEDTLSVTSSQSSGLRVDAGEPVTTTDADDERLRRLDEESMRRGLVRRWSTAVLSRTAPSASVSSTLVRPGVRVSTSDG